MDSKKFLMGTVAGGVAYFILGYLIYGLLLMNFMSNNAGTAENVMRAETDMVWWALIVGNLGMGALFSYIFLKWADVKGFAGGFQAAAVVGFFMSIAFDMINYGTTNIMNMTGALVDIVAFTVMAGLGGGVIAMVVGKK